MKEKEIPGLFVSVVTSDTVLWQEGLGVANLSTKANVTEDHLFRIGSISKTFTALAIMKLVEEGKLNLNTKLSDLAPEINFENRWKETHPVRLVHLLEHKAGFDDMHFSGFAKDREPGTKALDEVRSYESSMRSRWKPGLVHSYSNPGYVILGYLIEKVSGRPYQEYIRDQILLPLGMYETQFISEEGRDLPKQQFVTGYAWGDDGLTEAKRVKLMGESAGALLSNARDMSVFLQYLLNPVLQDSSGIADSSIMKEMEQLHGWFEQANGIEQGYGLGIYTKSAGSRDLDFLGHNGGINGFVSDYIYSRQFDLGIMVSNNLGVSNRAILNAIVDELLPDQKKGTYTAATREVTGFGEWEGEYRVLNSRNGIFDLVNYPFRTAKVSWESDSLVLTMFLGGDMKYGSVGGRAFVHSDDVYPSLYLADNEGEKALYFNDDLMVPVNSTVFLTLRISVALSLLLGLVATLSVLVRFFTALFKKSSWSVLFRALLTALPYWLLILSFYIFLSNSSLDKLVGLGQVGVPSVLVLLLTSLFPISVIVAGFYLFKNRNELKTRLSRFMYTSVLLGSAFLAVYCISFGWFALRLWAY
ncbi:MAG: beta-lactamase family protein [Roseivirga sp.]|nr:beta-lactamase family protein [Roseivirga sp.]